MAEAQSIGKAAEFVAPARVNILGEHTDYTGGLVLPIAIPFSTIATISPSVDGLNHFSSELFGQERAFPVDDQSEATGDWSDYPVGVLRMLQKRGIELPPFRLHLRGNVPLGAGLSSSASVEVASAFAMLSLQPEILPPEEIAVLCRSAENDYVNSPCGIMDQFVITMAKAGHALLLDTQSLNFEHIPMNRGGLGETCFVVCNSMMKHSIASGEYGARRREVEAGQLILRNAFPEVKCLGEATLPQLEACRAMMSLESFLRCRHIITENARVVQAKAAMFAGDPVALGELMLKGHASERDDFACSCDEIDCLVEIASQLQGCYGARLTGGGFGGCTVNLLSRSNAADFAVELKRAYHQHFPVHAETFLCEAVDGAMLRNAAWKEVLA